MGVDGAVVGVAADLGGDRLADHLRAGCAEVHAPAGAVAVEAVGDVEGLLEVVPQRKVEERPAGGGQLHAGGQSALDDGEVAAGQMSVQLVHVGVHLQALVGGGRCRVDARAANHHHPQRRHPPFSVGEGGDDPSQQVSAHPGAADGDDADLLVWAVAQLGAQRRAVGERRGVEAGDVAGEVVVGLRPLADQRQAGAERVGHDVVGVADEDRPVADARVAGDVGDHLGVVVGSQVGLALATIRHRQVAHEVGEPGVGEALEFGVLVQEVVDVPGLIADHEVVGRVGDDVGEHHEVGQQDLVHASQSLEAVQVVLGRFAFDVGRLVRQPAAGRVYVLTCRLQDTGHRMLSQPVDLDVGVAGPQLAGDRDVPLSVAEPDWRTQVEDALAPLLPSRPREAAARGR